MSFSRLLRKFSQPNFAHPAPAGSGNSPRTSSDDPHQRSRRREASEPTPTILRPWRRKRPSTMGRSIQSQTTSTPLLIPNAESPTPDVEVPEMPLPMPHPTSPGVVLTNLTMVPPPEMIPAVVPAPDKLAEAWDAVKVDPNIAKPSRGLDSVDDTAATGLDNAAPFLPVVTATVVAAGQTDLGKSIKEGIDNFSEGMPILMHALDELGSLHPFIGVVVLAFKTVYTLEQKRRDNDRKIVSLFVAMRDMMGALLLLKNMENDKLIGPDGTHIEDRLKSLVDRTADDIKICSNVCDAYTKKRLLAKVLLSAVWDAKFLDFINLFGTRRNDFEFELTMHTSQGVDKANAKLDAIGETTKALNEQMDVMKTLFQQLVSPEQKRLSELVTARGGLKVLKDNDKTLLELERAAEKVSGGPKAEVGIARREQPKGTTLDDLRKDVLEDPTVAVEKNLTVFSRKFEAQKNQIVDELTLVVKRESDRVIQEVKGGPHERILDRSIHEIWKEMGWRGNVKARHFVLSLRDHYLEKAALGIGSIPGLGTAGITGSPDPDAWVIKYVDITRVQPILEAMDDDASGFITIGEMNRFTSSRPIDWSLPHWVAFWAVGYRAAIIDYAHRIEDLFAKMEGIRSEILPLNLQSVFEYVTRVWEPVHTLITAVHSLQPSQDDPEKFKSYIEAEETRLRNNLHAVDFIIDGTDTLTLITGVGRVEKTVFPVLYLLMKHHYEIMRVMRTRVVDARELWEGVRSVTHVQEAISYRVGDLTNNFSQQRLDIEKQFQNFAYGMFKYFNDPKALWSGGYVRDLDPRSIPYDDTNEDQNIKPEEVLKFESSGGPSLDYWVYDGHSIDDIPTYRDVESPLRDILGHWHGYFYQSGGARESDGTDSMMTLVIEPAEGEQDFKANAWSVRGRFTLTGSWSNGENDVLQIKFKMAFPNAIWVPVFFNGRFDIELNALTGVWGYSSEPESSIGRMEFRRIPPRYLTVYPCIKDLSDNKSRSLWKFAIAAVRNDVRREHCPWSYFSQRRDDRKTVVSLTIRYLYFGKPLSGEEIATHYCAVQGLTAVDACFHGSMINLKRASTFVHDRVSCDSCGGPIGGARLFCFDCVNKDGDTYDSLDLCCAPESRCIEARITHRENLNGPHEPYHRLIKFRTVVLIRELGRTCRLARAAFERVEDLCAKIAGASQKPQEEGDTGKDGQDASTPEPTTAEVTSESVKPEGVPAAADDTKGQPEAERTTVAAMSSESDKSDDIPTATGGTRDGTEVEPEPTVTEKPNEVPAAVDGSKDETETKDVEGNISQGTTQAQPQTEDLPTCGKCKGSLSFPFWHCMVCEDNLFICDACDSEGVPELSRSSGKHTKEHHLIRCLPPKESEEPAPETEQRLISIESRLDDMQTRFDSLGGRFDDLTGRIGNIEQLLHRLVGASSGNGSAVVITNP